MTTPTGQIGLSDVNIELGRASTYANTNMNEQDVRNMAGIRDSGTTISMDDLRGKKKAFVYTVPGGSNINLRTSCNAAGYSGELTVLLTLSGTYTATATSVPAVDIGTWPAGTNLVLDISGLLYGYGGAGGGGKTGTSATGGPGGAGGPGLRATAAITSGSIEVNRIGSSVIRAGGGGGGGGGGGQYLSGTVLDGNYINTTGGTGGRGAGAQGTQTSGSAGGTNAGTGGSGGTYGAAGGSGSSGNESSGWSGGAAGHAFVGSAYMTRVGWASGSSYFGLVS